MKSRIVDGSCHCGAISYSASIDLSLPTIRCNCSICLKSRNWFAPIPSSNFKLTGAADAIGEYRFGDCTVTHCFCSRCGVKTHGRVHLDASGTSLVAVCVSTLNLTPAEFADIPISFIDGRNDRMEARPAVTSYL